MPSLSMLRRGSKSQTPPTKDGQRDDATSPTSPPPPASSAMRSSHDRSKSDGERLSKRELFQSLLGRGRVRASSGGSGPGTTQKEEMQPHKTERHHKQQSASVSSQPHSQSQRGNAESNGGGGGDNSDFTLNGTSFRAAGFGAGAVSPLIYFISQDVSSQCSAAALPHHRPPHLQKSPVTSDHIVWRIACPSAQHGSHPRRDQATDAS